MGPSILALAAAMVLLAVPALAQRLAVQSPVANIRSGPGTDYEVIWKIARYHPLTVVERSGKWIRFKDFEGDTGWIHESLVDRTATVITNNDVCNVRSGPGTKNPIRFTVGRGIPFKKLTARGNWIEVEHADGDRGWIHNSLVW